MFHHGGAKPFITGTFATVSRDMTFGGCFSVIRHGLQSNINADASGTDRTREHKVWIDMIAAICGTVVSSPLNYVRNIHYATHPADHLRTTNDILGELLSQARKADFILDRVLFVQRQLRIGWGTLRVGCGMAVGSKIYSMAVAMFTLDT